MKKIAVLIASILIALSIANAQKVKGSDTMLPLTQKAAEEFMKKNPKASIMVTGGGSGVGINGLMNGSADLAMSSRRIKFDEKKKFQEEGKTCKEVIVADDALTVIVNPKNPVSQLTREQLEGIYTGKITNWKEVGGDNLKIIVYSRETSSGTYEFFKESVLKKKSYMSSVLSMPATGAIMQSVSQTRGAIGYIGLAYLDNSVKGLKVSYDEGKTYVEPSVANAKNKTYPLVRPLIYYYVSTDEAKVKPFIDFMLSKEGQKIVSEIGFIPIK